MSTSHSRIVDHHVVPRRGGLERLPGLVGLAAASGLVQSSLAGIAGARIRRSSSPSVHRRAPVSLIFGRSTPRDCGVILSTFTSPRSRRDDRRTSSRRACDRRPASPYATAASHAVDARTSTPCRMRDLPYSCLKRFEPDDRGHAVADLFERARARPSAVGMHNQAGVPEVFPLEDVHHVGDVVSSFIVVLRRCGPARSCRLCSPRRPCRSPAADISARGYRSSSQSSRARR